MRVEENKLWKSLIIKKKKKKRKKTEKIVRKKNRKKMSNIFFYDEGHLLMINYQRFVQISRKRAFNFS